MSVPNNQQQLIRKYFNLLVKEFITDPLHNKDISIVFKDYLGSSNNLRTLGLTERSGGGSNTEWQVWENGVKVPGSEITTYFPYKYVISFLNHYKDENQLRGTVVHEFTHLYLYSRIGKHEHDDRFYSTMERLESWFDKNQGLSPRVDKSGDRYQYVGDNNSDTSDEEKTCPECSYPSPQHSPQCPHNQNKPRPARQPRPGQKPDITNSPQELAKFDFLKNLLETSQNLTALESNYQKIKNNPLYKGENKEELDNSYQLKKNLLQFSTNGSNSLNKGGMGRREYFLITLITVGIVFIAIIGYLVMSENQTSTKNKKIRK